MAARKRTQEEKNLRTLRELASLPANKQCFDCHQRGPTYVNMLVGSFVCTSCSGILRGLNPPHRVKSITMTVFTPEEVEFIRSRGNDYCRQVWLGLYDPRSLLEPESRDEQKVKEFMIQKYERKRWYVSPENVTFRSQQATPPAAAPADHTNSHQQQQQQQQHSQYAPDPKPLSSLLGKEPTPLVLHSPPQAPNSNWGQANSNLNHNSLNNNNNNNNVSRLAPATSMGNKGLDLLTELGADPFSPAPPPTQAQHQPPPSQMPATQVSNSSANGNFANFESAFSDSTSSGSSGFTPEASSGNTGFAVFQNNVISPPPPILNKVEASKLEVPPPADRYAALADLDSLFHAQQDSTLESQSPPPPAVPSSVSSPAPWGISSTATSSAPITNPTNSIFGQPYSAPNPFAVAAPVTDSWNSVPPQPHPTSAQKQQQQHVYNPFQQQQQQQQQQAFVSSPYTTAPSFNSMESYGGAVGPQPGFFNPYMPTSGQSVGGPTGDLCIQVPQYGMQNGGGGVASPFAPGIWANQSHAQGVGWVQAPQAKVMFPAVQPQANPFMTGLPAPKLNPGNPFL